MDAPAQTSPQLLEGAVPFAASRLWRLQRQYFAQRGRHAWRDGAVPHYVTTNPAMAAATAEVLVAFRLDRLRRDPAAAPLLICELGAGSGRFSYHLLLQLLELCERAGLDPAGFRVVLSDFCASNLQAWAHHPRLQPFFNCGLADRARVDLTRTRELRLEQSGLRWTVIRPGGLNEREEGLEREGVVFSGADEQESNSIPRRLVARVCLEALHSPAAEGRIIEITSSPQQPPQPLETWLAAS